MIHHPTIEDQLFEPPVEGTHVHLNWSEQEGWQVYVTHRHTGQPPELRCPAAHFDRLCWAEAVDVATASVWELLPFLAADPRW